MPEMRIFNRLFFVFVLTLSISACSKSPDEPAAGKSQDKPALGAVDTRLLQYVPADSPYVFASLEPLPDDVNDVLKPRINTMLSAYAAVVRAVIMQKLHEAEGDEGRTAAAVETVEVFSDEIASLMSIEGLEGAGVGDDSTMVFYGDGLLPVLRLQTSDGELMEQAIVRIEESVGNKMPVATIDGQDYRHAGDEKAQVIVAIIDDDLVISFVPANPSDGLLKSVLGLEKPGTSMAESGEMAAIAAENDFSYHNLFLLDFSRMASTFLDDPSGTNHELLSLMKYDRSLLSDVCKAEIREMAGIVPRLIAGYTGISVEKMSGNSIFEVRKDIAEGLATLVAPVQGLGTTEGGLFSFGMSLDVQAARQFYLARLDALEADPYECEHFAELQAGVAAGRAALNQPVPPVVYSIKGFLAVVDAIEGLDFATKQPPTDIDASFLLSLDNPQGLLVMGAMFSPELAALNLQADGKPVKIELPPVSPALGNAYIAMTDDSLAISLGSSADEKLAGLLRADYADPAPFMSMDMDAGKYYSFIGDMMSTAQATDEKVSPELNAAMSDLMHAMENWFGRMSVDVNFTERGVEMPSTIEFAEAE